MKVQDLTFWPVLKQKKYYVWLESTFWELVFIVEWTHRQIDRPDADRLTTYNATFNAKVNVLHWNVFLNNLFFTRRKIVVEQFFQCQH